MLYANNLTKAYGNEILFSDLSLNVSAGDRIALVGANGSGKSTLMDILAGETNADRGKVVLKRNCKVAYLKQEQYKLDNRPLLREVCEEPEEVLTLRKELRDIHDLLSNRINKQTQSTMLTRMAKINDHLEIYSHDNSEHKAKTILSGLGFNQVDFGKLMGEFSGGWIMRAYLGKMLFHQPDLLLLDEPTNHLDLEANLWFEEYLMNFKGAVLVTSHDRAFLNSVATSILAIEEEEIVIQKGNYDEYLISREQVFKTKQATAARTEKQIKKQMKFVERFRSKATKARQVQSRLKSIDKIEKIDIPRATKRVRYSFPEPLRSGTEVIQLENLNKSYGKNVVYKGVDLSLERGDKVALLGVNGAGKSTILKILAGVLDFDSGVRKLGHNVTTGYYSQHLLELLNPRKTIIQELEEVAGGGSRAVVRNILGGFLFSGDDINKTISVLSGGEKARVALAKLLLQSSNLLFMDEPTNHLDIESREILIDALNDYQGTLCFITHDRTFMHQVANKIVRVEDGRLVMYPGDYSSYLSNISKMFSEHDSIQHKASNPSQLTKGKHIRERSTRGYSVNKIRKLNQRIRTIELELENINSEMNNLERFFTDPKEIENPEQLAKLGLKHEALKKQSEELEREWEQLSSDVETNR
ncbi:MAG: ABC transporter ATP-binding protein [Dehalococcoidia bacterium]|nr:ABC transporter ATP-binding protein [Dehalococcoidia bacterium]MQG16508.1 ABC-F family ATP-binding cassette domain-containing protein [SAR202 cluster bacterium]|tara:strand:- start:13968 stop:15896 length:1929 start_codon:yes stop_codon:yes gene_type:complete